MRLDDVGRVAFSACFAFYNAPITNAIGRGEHGRILRWGAALGTAAVVV